MYIENRFNFYRTIYAALLHIIWMMLLLLLPGCFFFCFSCFALHSLSCSCRPGQCCSTSFCFIFNSDAQPIKTLEMIFVCFLHLFYCIFCALGALYYHFIRYHTHTHVSLHSFVVVRVCVSVFLCVVCMYVCMY